MLDRRLSGESGGDAIDLTIKGEQDDSDATGETYLQQTKRKNTLCFTTETIKKNLCNDPMVVLSLF